MKNEFWQCPVCGQPDNSTARCPVCGTDQSAPQSVPVGNTSRHAGDNRSEILVVGAGIAGVAAAEAARKFDENARIVLVGEERELPYYRLNLTRFLAGELPMEKLPLHPRQWYENRRIELFTGESVIRMDPVHKTILTTKGRNWCYDRLVLATGSRPAVPPLAGTEKKQIFTLRTLNDAQTLIKACDRGTKALVVGGGVLGLEVAAALASRGGEVTVVEDFDWLLPRQANPAAGRHLARRLEQQEIRLLCGQRVAEIFGGESVEKVVLESGEELVTNLLVFSIGVHCAVELAVAAGLKTRRGVLVDDQLRTSDPSIFAAGDVAEHRDTIYGTWFPAQAQGVVAGRNAAGLEASFSAIPRSNNLRVLDIDLYSIGDIAPEQKNVKTLEEDTEDGYYFFAFQDDSLIGAILMGDVTPAPRLKTLVESRASCEALLKGARNGADIRQRLMNA